MKGALLMLILACVVPGKGADPSKRTLSTDQAKNLVLAALSSAQRRLPKLEVIPDEGQSSPRFMFFIVSWEGLPDGSVIVGNYSVDPHTADVFSSTIACHEEKNAKLKALQAHLRDVLHLSESEYERLKTKGPLCE